MKKIKFILLSAIIITICISATAQSKAPAPTLPKTVEVGLPKLLNEKILKEDDLKATICANAKWGQKDKLKRFWIVYSDRNNNTTYSSPNESSTPVDELSFGATVIIAKIDYSSNMALVYKDKNHEHYPDIPSTGVESLGWISLDKLLLWQYCPTDGRGIYHKALIAINLSEYKQGEQYSKAENRRYLHPEDETNPLDLHMDMKFYYVMKRSSNGEKELLCEGANYNGRNLYGWVKVKYRTPWEQRTCLEPNWDPAFVESHIDNPARIYEAIPFETLASQWTFGKKDTSSAESRTPYRMKPAQLRYPILGKPENNAVKCTSFADRTSREMNVMSDYSDIANEVGRKIHQLNIIFVMEAMSDMAKYMPSIKEAISSSSSFLKSGQTLQVGFVIYKDLTNGASIISKLSDPKNSAFLAKLDGINLNGKFANTDRTVAVGQGLMTALDRGKLGYDPHQQNLIVIIGKNQGDESINDSELKRKLKSNNIQLLSIQVMRTPDGSCSNYYYQIKDIIKDNITAQYADMESTAQYDELKSSLGFQYKRQGSKNTNRDILYAQCRYGKMNEELSPSQLSKQLKEGISDFIKTSVTHLVEYNHALEDSNYDPKFLEKKLGTNGIKEWEGTKAITAYNGYAKLKDGDGKDYWHYVLFLSDDELEKTLKNLQDVAEAAKNREKSRKPFIDAMKSLVAMQLGEVGKSTNIDNLSPAELDELIYGLNVPTEAQAKRNTRSIADMSNSDKVPPQEYFPILEDIYKRYTRLKGIKDSKYPYRVKIQEKYYYWIPIEDVP